jgi:hypothetical protein
MPFGWHATYQPSGERHETVLCRPHRRGDDGGSVCIGNRTGQHDLQGWIDHRVRREGHVFRARRRGCEGNQGGQGGRQGRKQGSEQGRKQGGESRSSGDVFGRQREQTEPRGVFPSRRDPGNGGRHSRPRATDDQAAHASCKHTRSVAGTRAGTTPNRDAHSASYVGIEPAGRGH